MGWKDRPRDFFRIASADAHDNGTGTARTAADSTGSGVRPHRYSTMPTGAPGGAQPHLWTDQRIRSTVNEEYIVRHLKESERSRLAWPLAFGDGLTDDTYLDFILERAQKLYLALCEVGKSERIFRAIDQAYDDGDLPLPQETVLDLELAERGDDKVNRLFETAQHRYLLRELEEGGFVSYLPEETVPLEYVNKFAATASLQNWCRVRVPGRSDQVMVRRRLVTSPVDEPESFPMGFFEDLEDARLIEHSHIAPIWGSYTYGGAGYVLTPFVAEYTLKSYLDAKYPPQFGALSKGERQRLLLVWMHCLSDALAYLHANGIQHKAIRPSNIVVDGANRIAFSDIGCLSSFQQDKVADPNEVYDYGVPEAHAVHTPNTAAPSAPMKTHLASRLFRRRRPESKIFTDGLPSNGLSRRWDGGEVATHQPKTSMSQEYFQTPGTLDTSSIERSNGGRPFTQNPKSPRSAGATSDLHEKSDIFSLGCVFVNILSYMHRLRPSDTTKHIRSSRKGSRQNLPGFHTDSSFHANLPRVHSWLNLLEDRAFELDDTCFRAVPPMSQIVRAMLCPDPEVRPSAAALREHIKGILAEYAKIPEDDLHCGHQRSGEFDDKHASFATSESSIAHMSVASPGARNSMYTSSSKYASTACSAVSLPTTQAAPAVPTAALPKAVHANFSMHNPWGAVARVSG